MRNSRLSLNGDIKKSTYMNEVLQTVVFKCGTSTKLPLRMRIRFTKFAIGLYLHFLLLLFVRFYIFRAFCVRFFWKIKDFTNFNMNNYNYFVHLVILYNFLRRRFKNSWNNLCFIFFLMK